MAEETALFTQDPNTNEYVAYTPPEPTPFNQTLDEGLRENEHIKGFANADDMARSLVELRSGQPVVPETPDGYQFTPIEGDQIDSDRMARWKTDLHGLGLSQAQYEGIMRKALDEEAEGKTALNDAQAENRKVNESALQTKWGDKYQENVDGAIKFRDSIMTHMPDEGKAFVEFLNDTKFGDNPQVVEFFSQCAGLISEDAIQRGSPRPTGTEVGRSESGDVILDDYADMDR